MKMRIFPEIMGNTSSPKTWPVLDEAALYGLPGRIVQTLSPHTEADPVALLVHALAEFSCMIDNGPHVKLDGEPNPLLFWPVVVGQTSKSRKGSAAKRIGRLFQQAFPTWMRGQLRGTLSSGEGLAFAVRDEQMKENAKGEWSVIDEGVQDKRLFLVQSEFGMVLKVMEREGNSLSGALRDAWDGESLRPMTKSNRVVATRPHIAVVGHVTEEELLRRLTGTEMANGFGNRFVWFMVKRSNVLPFAQDPNQEELHDVAQRLREAGDYASNVQEIGLSSDASEAWRKVYALLSESRPGLCGALLGRAEAHVRRLAGIYALLDCKDIVDYAHLQAAIALWEYAEGSVEWLYGDRMGDPLADVILDGLRSASEGLTETQISSLVSRNVGAEKLAHTKRSLQTQGKIRSEQQQTGGRPITRWFAVTNLTK